MEHNDLPHDIKSGDSSPRYSSINDPELQALLNIHNIHPRLRPPTFEEAIKSHITVGDLVGPDVMSEIEDKERQNGQEAREFVFRQNAWKHSIRWHQL